MKIRKIILLSIIFILVFDHYAEAKETQIFYEDFESGVDNWDLLSGWSIISEGGNHRHGQ
jgi:hypothetical protein